MIDSSSPNQPIQNYEIVNPGLETQVAALLPSVAGYGGNLRATNTIIPIVDLTAAAEGSNVPESMQQAIAFGSQTAFEVVNTSTVIANVPGFYRAVGVLNVNDVSGSFGGGFTMTDGLSVKQVWASLGPGTVTLGVAPFDLIFYVDTGVSLTAFSDGAGAVIAGSVRQIATSDGTLVTPAGF